MSDPSAPKHRSSRRHGARLLNQLSGGSEAEGYQPVSKCTNPFSSDYEPTDRPNTRVSALSLRGSSTTTNSDGYSIVDGNVPVIDYDTLSKTATCCLHGRKCSKSDGKTVQRSKEAVEDDPSGAYETANKFLQMKNISKADIQPRSVSSKSCTTDPLKSVIENGIDESAMEKAFRRRRGVVAASSLTPGYGYESVAKPPADASGPSKPKGKSTGGEELYIEPDFNVINRLKRQSDREKERDTGSERVEPLISSGFSSSSSTTSGANDYGYELIADSAQARQPVVEKMKVAANYDPHLHKVYLGELTAKDAELRTKQKGTFKLYHQLPSTPPETYDALEPSFKLYIVYRNSKGNHYHFPIVGRKVRCVGSERTQLTVEYGEPAPFFNSLSSLVKFYETYVMLNSSHSLPDIFPWWLQDPVVPPRRRRRDRTKIVYD
uniref:SH2 domain-containing protein n=1 Tax=Panagrellus redivivus TaxID=6233 RepID=A0A7E4WAY1_PANRE